MSFEQLLKKAVHDYQVAINQFEQKGNFESDKFSQRSVQAHESICADEHIFREGLLRQYLIPLPSGIKLFYMHPLHSNRCETEEEVKKEFNGMLDGFVRISYSYAKDDVFSHNRNSPFLMEKISMAFMPGLCPLRIEEDTFWHHLEGYASDMHSNDSQFGRLKVSLGEGNGVFIPSVKGKFTELAEIHVYISNRPTLSDYIQKIKFPTKSLGTGELDAFFKHVDYTGLDLLCNA